MIHPNFILPTLDNFDCNNMLPATEEQHVSSLVTFPFTRNNQLLEPPVDSSYDESSVTPDVLDTSQSNSTPVTIPGEEEDGDGDAEEEESLFVTEEDEVTVHYGMVSA